MTEGQVKNGQHILKNLTQARNIKKELENDQSYFVIFLKNRTEYGHTIDFNDNIITQKFFLAIEDHIGVYLHGLIDNEIRHFEEELNAI